MMGLSDFLFNLMVSAIVLFIPIAVIIIFVKRRRAKARLEQEPDGPLKETAQDLARAEEELREMPLDIREKIVETHELYDRFTTHRGYSNVYMEALTKAIRDAGIECELVFQATLPMGVADAIVEPQGVFELYILRRHLSEARKLIPKLIETPVQGST